MEPTVVALVLARDRSESLERLVRALLRQTRRPDEIFVVNNDATPCVTALIERLRGAEPSITTMRLNHNHGGAGGFAAGMERVAARERVDLIWAFDDDAIPETTCLERLLVAMKGLSRVGAVGAASAAPGGELAWALHAEGRRDPVGSLPELREAAEGRPALSVKELAWHALLIPLSAVRRVGLPRADLFMWYEDVDYGLRLRGAGLRLYVVPDARVAHPVVPNTVRARFLGVTLDAPVTNAAKSYLMIRNSLVVRHAHGGHRFWYVDLPLTLLRGALVARALGAPRPGVLRHVVARAVLDAARGRMGPPPAATLSVDAARESAPHGGGGSTES